METKPTPTIYSYYSPDVERVVRRAISDMNAGALHRTLKQNFHPGLDELHLPLMEKYEQFARSEGVIGLDTFEEKYFTNGSSEGIFHILCGLLPGETLYQFDGEYQGYVKYAGPIGRKIETVANVGELMACQPGIVIMSNPASVNGNAVDPNLIKTIGQKHQIILDLAYMGMTQKPLNVDLTNSAILAVLGSLSKPFGLYYFRIGFCYSRFPIASLYANKWFKNAHSIKVGEAVLDHFDPKTLLEFKAKYFEMQKKATKKVQLWAGNPMLPIKPSDVWLLAYNDQAKIDKCSEFNRTEDTLRFCLTPYYMEEEH